MFNTLTPNTGQAAHDRIADTERHLRRHGRSLCDLLDALDMPTAFDAFCDLHGAFGTQQPNARMIEDALAEIEQGLARQTASAIDTIARKRKFDTAAIRWHGARISELLERFRSAH